MAEGLLAKENIEKYVLAGNAIFTIVSRDNVRYTYKMYKKKDNFYYVYMLRGEDNTSDYSYIGFYYSDTMYFGPTAHYKEISRTSWPRHLRVIDMFLTGLDDVDHLDTLYKVYHSGRCARCGRLLTTPESIECGLGPECRKYEN